MVLEDGEKGVVVVLGCFDVIVVVYVYYFCLCQVGEVGDSCDVNCYCCIYCVEIQQNNYCELQQQGGDGQQDIDQVYDGGFYVFGQCFGEGVKGGIYYQVDGNGDQCCRQGMYCVVNYLCLQVVFQLVGIQLVVCLWCQVLSVGDFFQWVSGGKLLWGNGY